MTARSALSALQHLHRLAHEQQTDKLSDRECLERFRTQRDEEAFAVLVRRHGPMVRGVCRRVLRHDQDAEDVFQATFLVLAKKAGSIRWQRSIAPWLYQVAYRLAHKDRVQAARRREQQATVEPAAPMIDESWREVGGLLDAELQALAEKYRAPLVLCYLQGQTRDEAAERLGWSLATLKRRLHKGRELLRLRLMRRGVTLPAVLLPAALGGNEAESALALRSLAQAATTFASGGTVSGPHLPAMALAKAMLRMMSISTLKLTAMLLLTLSLATGAGLWTCRMLVTESPQAQPASPPKAEKEGGERQAAKDERPRTDRYGDPLPPGAIARIGTVRFRESDAIFALAYSPDGKMVASGAGGYPRENRVHLWNAATGKQLLVLQPELNQIISLAFSPNGKLLASICGERGQSSGGVHVWDTTTGQEIRALRHPETSGWMVAFSLDGRRLVAGGWDKVCFWDTTSGKETLRIHDPKQSIYSFALSPDGKTLATANHEYTICLWDALTGKERRRLTMPKISQKYLSPSVTFSPDSKVVAGGSSDGSVYLWDAATGREHLKIPGHNKWRNAHGVSPQGPNIIVFSPDGKTLAAGNEGIVYDAATGKERCRLQSFRRWIRSLVFSPDGKTLAGEGDYRVRYWDAAAGKEIFKDTAHRNLVSSIVFSPDGKMLFTAGCDDSAGAWETATGRELFRFQGHSEPEYQLNQIAVSPDGKTAAAWLTGVLYSWDVRQPKPVQKYSDAAPGPDARYGPDSGYGLAFSPQGRLLAALWKHEDERIRLWAEGTAKAPRTLKVHESGNNGLIFSSDGKTLASAGSIGKAGLWDVAAGQELRTIPGFYRGKLQRSGEAYVAVFSMAFSPDNKILALGGSDGTIGLWDKDGGREIRHLASPSYRGWVQALAFAPDGKTVAAGYQDGTVRFWETATVKVRREWPTHTGNIFALAFSPDGRLFASAGSDTTVLIWTADEQTKPRDFTAKELETLWSDLAGDDAVKAYRAIGVLASTSKRSVPFLAARLHPLASPDPGHLARLIADLDSDQFTVRDKAMHELDELGELAEAALRKMLAAKPSLEARRRVEELLTKLRGPLPAGERLRSLRAMEVLEHAGSEPARRVLTHLASGAPEARLTREANAALQRLTAASPPR